MTVGSRPTDRHEASLSRRACSLALACRGRALLALVAVSGGFVFLARPASASTPRPAASAGSSFTFSGAVSGTLHLTPADTICSVGPTGGGAAIFDTLAKLKAPYATVAWVIHVTSILNGHFRLGAHSLPEMTLQYTTDGGLGTLWTSTSGTLAAKGGAGRFTGSISAELKSAKGSTIHTTGSWSCKKT